MDYVKPGKLSVIVRHSETGKYLIGVVDNSATVDGDPEYAPLWGSPDEAIVFSGELRAKHYVARTFKNRFPYDLIS